jgi:RNA polymerase sigma factor (sigma-70 family)
VASARSRHIWAVDAHETVAAASAGRWPRASLALLADERLARLAGAGNEDAFAALYARYHQQLYRYCRSLLRHDSDAQDALQATFTRAYAALREERRDAPLRPWLYRIAHNEAFTLLRRRRPHVELDERKRALQASAEEQVAGRERLETLVADLRELPERQRGALVMRELSGLSHQEIALALHCSVGTAKQAIFEARRSLQEFAEGRAMACEEICRVLSDGDRRSVRRRRVRAHLRGCASCAAFAAAIPARRTDLAALTPPMAAGGMLAAVLGHGASPHGGAGALAGVAGKSAGVLAATKAAVGVAIVAGAAVSLTSVVHHEARPAARPARVSGTGAPGARPSSRSRPSTTTARPPGAASPALTGAHEAGAARARALLGMPAAHGAGETRRSAAGRAHATPHAGRRSASRSHRGLSGGARGRSSIPSSTHPPQSKGTPVGKPTSSTVGDTRGHTPESVIPRSGPTPGPAAEGPSPVRGVGAERP